MIKLKTLLMEALEWKDIPDDVKSKVYEMVKKHNDSVPADSMDRGLYIVDVTGKYQAYYTLWRFKDIPPKFAAFIKNPVYMGNLTTDLLSSIEKLLSKPAVKNVKIAIESDETRKHLIGKTTKTQTFTFGKYRGKTFPEVYLENPEYFVWLQKNRDPKYGYKEKDAAIDYFVSLYFDDMTKKNVETSKSQFLGAVGTRITGEFKIYSIAVKDKQAFSYYQRSGELGKYYVYKMVDGNDNKVIASHIEKALFDMTETDKVLVDKDGITIQNAAGQEKGRLKIGDTIKITGKITDTYEAVGIKFTKLGYIKKA